MSNNFASRHKITLKDLKGTKEFVLTKTSHQIKPSSLIYFHDCGDGLQVEINDVPGKIILENCKNMNLKMKASLTTGVLEIIGGENIQLFLSNLIPIITVDKCNDCSINVESPNHIGKIISTEDCQNLRIINTQVQQGSSNPTVDVYRCGPKEIKTKRMQSMQRLYDLFNNLMAKSFYKSLETNGNDKQWISQFHGFGNSHYQGEIKGIYFMSEVAVREGAGHITTKKEKDMADRRQQQLEQQLEQEIGIFIGKSYREKNIVK